MKIFHKLLISLFMALSIAGQSSYQQEQINPAGVAHQPALQVKQAIGYLNQALQPDSLQAATAPGDLDTTFAGTGKSRLGFGFGRDFANAVAAQPDGKVVVVGVAGMVNNLLYEEGEFGVIRYNVDGSLDTSFGSGGKVRTLLRGCCGVNRANAVRIQADGKIVVAGEADNDFALARYNADGSLDTSFNGTGKVRTPIGAGDSRGNALKLQTDGKIVVAGISHNTTDSDFAVVRYNTDGSLDTSFGIGGIVTTPIGTNFDAGSALAIQPDGKILVAGASSNASGRADFAVVMYNPDGSLDTSYGSGGKVVVDLSDGGIDEAYGVALDATGRALVVGESAHLFGVMRLTASSRVAQNVSTQPTNQTACAGASASFSVTATDTNPSYLWRKK